MTDIVFISDLHLNPDQPEVTAKFEQFLHWAAHSVKVIYILGDFFHAWPGDDAIDTWCKEIAKKIKRLKSQGVSVYYLHGNRDFLLDKGFAELTGWTMLTEPALIDVGQEKVLLMHGDSYCTKDTSHQRFRRLTRNALFKKLFLLLPFHIRSRLVQTVRRHSQSNTRKPADMMDVVEDAFLKHMQKLKVHTLIHGHTHKPDLHYYESMGHVFKRYVLSDWDDMPSILCYDVSNGFNFTLLSNLLEEVNND